MAADKVEPTDSDRAMAWVIAQKRLTLSEEDFIEAIAEALRQDRSVCSINQEAEVARLREQLAEALLQRDTAWRKLAGLKAAVREGDYAVGVVGGAAKETRPVLEAIAAGLREKAAAEDRHESGATARKCVQCQCGAGHLVVPDAHPISDFTGGLHSAGGCKIRGDE